MVEEKSVRGLCNDSVEVREGTERESTYTPHKSKLQESAGGAIRGAGRIQRIAGWMERTEEGGENMERMDRRAMW